MKGQKGYSLMELVTGLGIFSILVLIASILTTWAVYRYYSVRDRLIAEATAYRGETLFRSTFGQAIDVDFTTGIVPASLGGRTGVIHHTGGGGVNRAFVFDEMADSALWTRIATFYREQGTAVATGAAARGNPLPTTVFYREPSLTTSGVIFFDLSTTAGANPVTSPDYSDAFIDRVSYFEIVKSRHRNAAVDKTTSIEVAFRIRYHLFAGRANNWCPQLDIQSGTGGCNNGATTRDFEKRFHVFLANNLIKIAGTAGAGSYSSVDAEERASGNIYFFKSIVPMR